MRIGELKRDARLKLEGKWNIAIGISFIYLIISYLVTTLSTNAETLAISILSLIISIITIPFSFGVTASFMKISRNEPTSITDFVNIGLKFFGKSISLSISVFLKLLVPVICIILLVALAIMASSDLVFSEDTAAIVGLASVALTIVSTFWLCYKSLSYTFSSVLLFDNPEAKNKEIINKSAELMKGNKLKYILLIFSFFGWALIGGILGGFLSTFFQTFLGATIGGIISYLPSAILAPYISVSEINFYEDLAGISNVTAEVIPDEVNQ